MPTLQKAARDAARIYRSAVNVSSSDRWHVTLAFLGEIDEQRLAEVDSIVASWREKVGKIAYHVGKRGSFPDRARARVLFVSVKSAELEQAQAMLLKMLGEAGVECGKEIFQPHVTIARAKTNVEATEWTDASMTIQHGGVWDHAVVFESELRPGGQLYRPIETYALRG